MVKCYNVFKILLLHRHLKVSVCLKGPLDTDKFAIRAISSIFHKVFYFEGRQLNLMCHQIKGLDIIAI